ncbi:MAG: hypothetical protein HWN68_18835 [Desulfobacterales bacterium]|nr:hypothetical protein [Desulfobacterales bacterium]
MMKAAFILFLLVVPCAAYGGVDSLNDYSLLVELMKLEECEQPLYAFNDFEEDCNKDDQLPILQYFNEHGALVKRIQKDLDNGAIRWKLDKFAQRLVFVPEKRERYANLFESYCNDVINYTLRETGLNNPYQNIQTLLFERPVTSSSGIIAFLVHNLAREYVATCAFSNEEQKKVNIKLRGTVFLGQVGSYSSYIHMRHDGTFAFERDWYTIWQNTAKNPYTALIVPAEETLHIILRQHTERAIKYELESRCVKVMEEVDRIANDWIAVEEAIIGGIVYSLLPKFITKYVNNLPPSLIEEDIESRAGFKQYKHVKSGIKMVQTMGCDKAIKAYTEDPFGFRKSIIS